MKDYNISDDDLAKIAKGRERFKGKQVRERYLAIIGVIVFPLLFLMQLKKYFDGDWSIGKLMSVAGVFLILFVVSIVGIIKK